MRILTPSLVALIVLAGGTANASKFIKYREQIVTDVTGKHYVVVKFKNPNLDAEYGPVTLTIAETKPGASAIRPALSTRENLRHLDRVVRVRDGDIVHGSVDRGQPPGHILISSTGKWIVTVDHYGWNLGPDLSKDYVVVYSNKGDVVHRKAREDLFDENTRFGFPRGINAPTLLERWCLATLLDEKRDEVVIIGHPRKNEADLKLPVLSVSLKTGEVRQGGLDIFDRIISEPGHPTLADALDIAKTRKLAGSKSAWPAILNDEALALRVRLRAAVLLASFGDRRGADLVIKAAMMASASQVGPVANELSDDVSYAIRSLPQICGNDAPSVLQRIVQDGNKDARALARSVIASIQPKTYE